MSSNQQLLLVCLPRRMTNAMMSVITVKTIVVVVMMVCGLLIFHVAFTNTPLDVMRQCMLKIYDETMLHAHLPQPLLFYPFVLFTLQYPAKLYYPTSSLLQGQRQHVHVLTLSFIINVTIRNQIYQQ